MAVVSELFIHAVRISSVLNSKALRTGKSVSGFLAGIYVDGCGGGLAVSVCCCSDMLSCVESYSLSIYWSCGAVKGFPAEVQSMSWRLGSCHVIS